MSDDRRVQVFEDAAGEWRWRRVAGNGEIVATSGEGYTRRDDAFDAARRENPGLPIDFPEKST